MQPVSQHSMGQFNQYADTLRKRLPEIPGGVVDVYVAWAPWVALIGGVVGFVVMLWTFAVGAALGPFFMLGGMAGVQAGVALFLGGILLFIGAGLDAVGGYLMLRHSLTGWWLLAAGLILSALGNVVSLAFWGLLITLVILYVHLEAKARFS